MSELLDALIEQRRKEALDYKEYLEKLEALVKTGRELQTATSPIRPRSRPGRSRPCTTTSTTTRSWPSSSTARSGVPVEDSWRGSLMKERKVRKAIRKVLTASSSEVDPEEVLELAKHQE